MILKAIYPMLNKWLDDSIAKLGSPKTGNECPNQLYCNGAMRYMIIITGSLRCGKPFMSSRSWDGISVASTSKWLIARYQAKHDHHCRREDLLHWAIVSKASNEPCINGTLENELNSLPCKSTYIRLICFSPLYFSSPWSRCAHHSKSID